METLLAEKAHIEKELSSQRQLNAELQNDAFERHNQISEHQWKVTQMQDALDRSAEQANELKVHFQNELKAISEDHQKATEQVRTYFKISLSST
jgi:type II secretory pathway component PulM